MHSNDFDLELGTATAQSTPVDAEIIPDDLKLDTQPAATIIMDSTGSDMNPLATELRKSMTPEELEKVKAFVPKIDLTDPSVITNYALNCQGKLNSFSDDILKQAQLKDLGTIGDALLGLVTGLEEFTPSDERIPQPKDFGFKRKIRLYIERLRARYSTVKDTVDKAEAQLRNHLLVLSTDQKNLSKFEDLMLQYLRELTMYIVAGYERLESVQKNELEELRIQAEASPNSEASLRYEALLNACDRFDKKLNDLALSRNVAIQTVIQGRIMQNNDVVLSDKITSTINNTIPLWKSQMVISLGIANSLSALEAQEKATNMTNFLLRENSKNLRQGTVRLAKANERGIVDIETLVQTNQELIATVTEVQQIQSEGRAKRKAAETELVALEKSLKEQMLRK